MFVLSESPETKARPVLTAEGLDNARQVVHPWISNGRSGGDRGCPRHVCGERPIIEARDVESHQVFPGRLWGDPRRKTKGTRFG